MDAAMTLQERKPEICITHDFGKEFQSDWHHSSAYKKSPAVSVHTAGLGLIQGFKIISCLMQDCNEHSVRLRFPE